MAIHHHATVSPTKDELLAGWVPAQAWYDGPADVPPARFASYRFDDPAGEVGMEAHLLRCGDGPVLQVPLSYRGAPLPGGEAFLVGTMEHSSLGARWIYDATGDPVYAASLAATVLGGGREADLFRLEEDGSLTPQEPSARVRGSGRGPVPEIAAADVARDGDVTVLTAAGLELRLLHVLGRHTAAAGEETLLGTWPGHHDPVLLATARLVR